MSNKVKIEDELQRLHIESKQMQLKNLGDRKNSPTNVSTEKGNSPMPLNKTPLLPNKIVKKNYMGLSQNASSPTYEGQTVKKVTIGKGHV